MPWFCMARKANAGSFKTGQSGNPSGGKRTDSVDQRQANLSRRLDAWLNESSGLGVVGKDKTMCTRFELDLVDVDSAQMLWRGDPIAARLIETPPNECLRQGYELCIGDDEPPDTYTPEPQPNPIAQQGPQPVASSNQPPKASASPAKKMDIAQRKIFARKHPSAFARITRKAILRNRMDAGEAKPLQEAITKKFSDIQVNAILKECMCYERAGGGAAALIGANDFTTDLRLPLNMAKVRGGIQYLTPLEAREITPLYYYNDPMKPKFGQAAIYQLVPFVIGAPVDNTYQQRITQIHESRLLIFPGIRTTRRVMMGSMNGWGDNIFCRVIRALSAFNTGYQNAAILLSDFAQAVYKIKGLAGLIAQNPNALTDSMMNVELGRSIARAVVIDADESFERKSTTMTGYPETLDRFAQNLTAAGDMPLTLLMGTSPGGLNATGASDIRFFYDRIASMQMLRVAPLILRLVEIELASMGEDPDKVNHSIKFKPLWQPTEQEIAQAHLTQAQADALYITNDVASAEEIALSRFGGDQYSYETRIDFEARASQEAIVAPTVDPKPVAPPPMSTDIVAPPPAGTMQPTGKNTETTPADA